MFKFKNEIDQKNREIIISLVKKYFYLDDSSLNFFINKMYNPDIDIDKVYERNIGNDLRFKVKIEFEEQELIDKAWKKFQIFKHFINHYKITYPDFRINKIKYNGHNLKIFRLLSSYYSKEENYFYFFIDLIEKEELKESKKKFKSWKEDFEHCSYSIDKFIKNKIYYINDYIGNIRLPVKQNLYLVLSLNFADWFLCSTGESWSSCLNLESKNEGMFWTGLPGLIGDKNRAMLYLTTGEKKDYLNIKVDKMLCRSWILLDELNNLNFVRFFPQQIVDINCFNRIFNNLKRLDKHFKSKYPVKLLFFENSNSAFIYQDYTKFSKKYLKFGQDGIWYYKNNILEGGAIFGTCNGFSSLIKYKKTIKDYIFNNNLCSLCEDEIYENEICYSPTGDLLCQHCFSEHYYNCNICSNTEPIHVSYNIKDELICPVCFHNHYYICECGEIVNYINLHTYKEKKVCEFCFHKSLTKNKKKSKTIEERKENFG